MAVIWFLRLLCLAFALMLRGWLRATSIILCGTSLVPYVDAMLFLQSGYVHLASSRLLGLVQGLLAFGLVLLGRDDARSIKTDGIDIYGYAVAQVLGIKRC